MKKVKNLRMTIGRLWIIKSIKWEDRVNFHAEVVMLQDTSSWEQANIRMRRNGRWVQGTLPVVQIE